MGVFGFYDLRPKAEISPLDWFRGQVAARADDSVKVHGYPQTLAALAAFIKAHRVERDFVGVIQESISADPLGDIELLSRELPRTSGGVKLTLTRGEERSPWAAIGLRKRKILKETETIAFELTEGFVFAWLSYDNLPAFKDGAENGRYEAWRDEQERAYLEQGLRRLGHDRLPELSDWEKVSNKELVEERWVDVAPPPGILLARPRGAGNRSVFPCTCALTVAVPSTAERAREVVAAFLREPTGCTLAITAHGSSAEILAEERWWPSPKWILAPNVHPVPSSAVAFPEGFAGSLHFSAELRTGPRGGLTDVSLWLTADAPPRLSVSARGGLDDKQIAKLEDLLGARLALSGVG
jgi:hypothetical protein